MRSVHVYVLSRETERKRVACGGGGVAPRGEETHTRLTWFTEMTHESLKSREAEVTIVQLTPCSCLRT